MKARSLQMAAVLWMACGGLSAGESRQLTVPWEELEAHIASQKVAFVLPDGTGVEGRAISVEPDGLRINVSKSSNRRAQPKGRHLIPRQSISTVRLTKHRKRGRLVGALGGAALAGGIVAASYPDLYEGSVVVVVPVVSAVGILGAAIGGYYTGKAIDKHVTEIRIAAAAPSALISRQHAGP